MAKAQKIEIMTEEQNTVVAEVTTPEVETSKKGVRATVIKPTEEQIAHLATLGQTSAKIRYLIAQGYSTTENRYSGIANYLGILTQHVRNVATQQLKRAE